MDESASLRLIHCLLLFSSGQQDFFPTTWFLFSSRVQVPRPKNVDELKQHLLYNNTLDVWTALCSERGRDWKSLDQYYKFLDHLKNEGVKLDVSVVCPPIKGFSDKPPKAFNIKLDDPTIQKIRLFP
jgi:hypothetical protein